MITFSPDERFKGARLNRIGIDGHTLYLAPSRSQYVEIWKCHCLIPNSWETVVKIYFKELIFKIYGFDKLNNIIYCLCIGILNDCEYPEILLIKIDGSKFNSYNIVKLDIDSGDEFENNVLLDNISMVSSGGRIFMYDGSIIKGDIPYWEIIITQNDTFQIIDQKIIDKESEERKNLLSTRFPVILDAEEKKILRLTNTSSILIYNKDLEDWVEYTVALENDLNPCLIENKGLKESYGSMGHRVKAVESKLQLVSNGNYVVGNVLDKHKYHFYEFQLNEIKKEYSFKILTSFKWTENYFKMFYPTIGDDKIIFISDQIINIVPLRPLYLREAMFWQYQTLHCKISKDNAYVGGISENDVKNIIGCKGIANLV
uniref:DUF295 domain-containing protein n=1 Tax=Strongyloides venezuelensis TaxID=75913 RepID=A0A0K0FXG0_STRVS